MPGDMAIGRRSGRWIGQQRHRSTAVRGPTRGPSSTRPRNGAGPQADITLSGSNGAQPGVYRQAVGRRGRPTRREAV